MSYVNNLSRSLGKPYVLIVICLFVFSMARVWLEEEEEECKL